MKPRKNYRSRPVKHGAKKRQKILSQKRKLVASGCEKEKLDKMNSIEIRELLKKTAKRKRGKALVKKKTQTSKTKTKEKKKTVKE